MTPLPCSHIDHDALTLGHPHYELPDPKTRRSTWRHYENFAAGASAILGGAKLESLLQEPHQPTVSQSRHCEFHTHDYLRNATEFRKFSPQSTGKPVQNATLDARRQTRALVYRRSCNAPGVERSGTRAARQLSTELPREVVTVSLSCAPRSALRAMEIGRHLGSHPPPHSDVGRYAAHDRACEFCVSFDAVLRLPEEVRADGARCREPGEGDQDQSNSCAVAHRVPVSVRVVSVSVERSSCPECCSSESRKHGQSTDSFVRALTKLSAEISGRSPRSYGPSRLRPISPPSQRPTSAQPHAGSQVNSSRLTALSKQSCTRRLQEIEVSTAGIDASASGHRYRAGRLQRGLPASRLRRESGGATPTTQTAQVIGVKRAEVQGSATIIKGVESLHEFSSPASLNSAGAIMRVGQRGYCLRVQLPAAGTSLGDERLGLHKPKSQRGVHDFVSTSQGRAARHRAIGLAVTRFNSLANARPASVVQRTAEGINQAASRLAARRSAVRAGNNSQPGQFTRRSA